MAVDHHVGLLLGQFLGRLSLLGFLGEDADPAARKILEQPSVVNIEACIAFAAPAMPAKATRLAFGRWDILQNLRFHRKTKGLEVEERAVIQLWTLPVIETDVCLVGIIGCPEWGFAKERPHINCAQSSDNNFV